MKKFLSLLLLIFMLQPPTVSASTQTVRVAFLPDMFGFYQIAENGSYSGYNYDYLMNLSQHTGWEYEFVMIEEGLVSTSLAKAQEMLKNGEIDLLGPFSSTSSNFNEFESGTRNYGVYRYNLYSAQNRYNIVCDNYFLQDTLRVALVDAHEELNQKFLHIMEEVDVDLDISYVSTHGESHELLFAEEVDALLNLDMSVNVENLTYLTTIQRIPFYFVSTKGNTDLIAQLDEAIAKVEIIEPEIHQILLEKHFGTRYDGDFLMTDEETTVLSEIDSLKVGLISNTPPYQYFDESGNKIGITIDILRLFEDIINIPFEVVWSDSYDALHAMVLSKEVDIVATLPNDYTLANSLNVILTNPYISSSAYWLQSVNEVENPTVLKHFVSSTIPNYQRDQLGTTFEIESNLKEMNEHGTYSIFCDPHITAYYTSILQLDNIQVRAATNVSSEISLGVASHIDVNVIGMLNRAILYLDQYELDEIIYNHTSITSEYTLIDVFYDNIVLINTILLGISLCIVISISRTSKKFRDLSRRDSLTKLFNAGYFHEYAENKIPELHKGALILIDIDYFKDVNDTFGHHGGDEVIKEVSKNMLKIGTDGFTHARVGGDEFAILIEGSVKQEELEVKLRQFLEDMLNNQTGIKTTLSIGGYFISQKTDYTTLYKQADRTLYNVKEKGRNGFLLES